MLYQHPALGICFIVLPAVSTDDLVSWSGFMQAYLLKRRCREFLSKNFPEERRRAAPSLTVEPHSKFSWVGGLRVFSAKSALDNPNAQSQTATVKLDEKRSSSNHAA